MLNRPRTVEQPVLDINSVWGKSLPCFGPWRTPVSSKGPLTHAGVCALEPFWSHEPYAACTAGGFGECNPLIKHSANPTSLPCTIPVEFRKLETQTVERHSQGNKVDPTSPAVASNPCPKRYRHALLTSCVRWQSMPCQQRVLWCRKTAVHVMLTACMLLP